MNDYTPQPWRMSDYYPEQYAKSSAALDSGIDYDEGRFEAYEAEFVADLSAYTRQVKADAWDEARDAIHSAYSTAFLTNPYRITEENN